MRTDWGRKLRGRSTKITWRPGQVFVNWFSTQYSESTVAVIFSLTETETENIDLQLTETEIETEIIFKTETELKL